MSKSRPPVAVIAGPTASGKSALAVALAVNRAGIVINADSAQIYAGLEILSSAPGPADRAAADHRLFGWRNPADPCSAADWAVAAAAEVARAHSTGLVPIIVGGTGLYLRTLLDGIAPVPPIDPEIRAEVRAASVAENHAALVRLDPVASARLAPADTSRVARALEVVRSTGRPLADWHHERSGGIGATTQVRPILLLPDRAWLNRRCDRRFESMLGGGAIGEVAALLARELDPALPAMRAIGVREIGRMLAGEADEAATLAAGQNATRRYAKRQYTWFANQPPRDWPRFEEPLDGPSATERALALLDAEG